MIEIELTPEEESQCLAWAVAIQQRKLELGRKSRRYAGTLDDVEVHRLAFRAELALAKALGIPLSVEVLDGNDGGIDLVLPVPIPEGVTVDVKWRSERERDLATDGLNFHYELRADLYVLAWPGDEDRVCLVGYCTRGEFLYRVLSRPPVRLRGWRYEMRWQELHPIEELLAKVERAREELHNVA